MNGLMGLGLGGLTLSHKEFMIGQSDKAEQAG